MKGLEVKSKKKFKKVKEVRGEKRPGKGKKAATTTVTDLTVRRQQVREPRAVPATRRRRLDPEVTARLERALAAEADLIEDLRLKTEAAIKRRNDLAIKLCDRGLPESKIGALAKITGPRVNQIYKAASQAAEDAA